MTDMIDLDALEAMEDADDAIGGEYCRGNPLGQRTATIVATAIAVRIAALQAKEPAL